MTIQYIVNCSEIVPSFAIQHNIKSWISVFTEKLESTCLNSMQFIFEAILSSVCQL